jgi:N,N'-diacetylchitobiose transport system permease protein
VRGRLFLVSTGVVLLFGVLFPLYWGVRTSLTSDSGASLLPRNPTLENYRFIFSQGNFGNTVLNSVIVSIGAVLIAVPSAALAAYALARLSFAGKRLGAIVLVLPLLPAVAVLVPLIVYARAVGLYNTLYAVILGAAGFSLPFAIWMIRGFIMSVPAAVEEAALVDGCGALGVLGRVVLPLVTPGLIAATVFVFITAWNNYLLAVAFTTTEQLQVVPVAIVGYTSTWGTNYGGMNAAATVAMVPPLLFFFAVQRWFVQGVLAGAGR